MGIRSVTRIGFRGGEQGTFEAGSHEYTDTLQVISDDPEDGPYTIAMGCGYNLGDPHPEDPESFLHRVNPSRAGGGENRIEWQVQLDYSSRQERPDDPFAKPPEKEWSSLLVPYAALVDRDGNRIVNTANCFYNPQPEEFVAHAQLTVTRNEPSFNGMQARQFVNRVNASTFSGGPPETVWCGGIRARNIWDVSIGEYYSVSYEFEFAEEGWTIDVLECGLMCLKPVSGGGGSTTLVRCIDSHGQAVSEPVALTAQGDQAPSGTPPIRTRWNTKKLANFNSLSLGI